MRNEVLQGSASTILAHGERLEILIDHGANKCSEEVKQWLSLMNTESCKHNLTAIPMLQKVPQRMREIQANIDCYDPLVVSIGPYHHGKPKYADMEKVKRRMACNFADNEAKMLETLYNKIMDVAEAAKKFYKDDEKGTVAKFNHEVFTKMMFLDGCFVLQFLEIWPNKNFNDFGMKNDIAAFVGRDLFLLENQLPFQVLKELMMLKLEIKQLQAGDWSKSLSQFIEDSFGPFETEQRNTHCSKLIQKIFRPTRKDSKEETGNPQAANRQQEDGEPAHLLGFTRTRLIGKKRNDIEQKPRNLSSYRSVKELKAAGINFEQGKTKKFTDVEFKQIFLRNKLILPPLTVDDSTKSMLLNMVAYEACPGDLEDFSVTSYICFLDSLIDHAEDVKELRSKGILKNLLGSDQQVADVFNQIADNLVPDPNAYVDVQGKIEDHYKSKIKNWLADFWHTHFSSPWTILAFLGAIFALVLSVIQTYESMLPGQRES